MGLQMIHGRPCAYCCPSSSSSSSSSWMMQALPPKQSHHPLNGGKPIFSESLAALAMHLLLKRRRDRSSRDIASSAGVLQITENKSAAANLTKHKSELQVMSAERKLLDDALDRTSVQYDSWIDEETSFWMDRDNTNSNLQYGLLMQNLQELETSLDGKDLKTLENDILAHIEQLGALRSFNASMNRATLLDNQTHDQPDSSLLDHQIIKFDPETPLDEEQEGSEVVVVRSGKSQERKLRRIRASEKGTRISVKVNPRRPKKSSRKASSSQFISEWKSHPGRRRIIVREQSALLATIKECASLEKIREKMVKEGQEVSYHRWAEAAGVDEAELMSRLQAGYCCRERLLVTTEWLVRCIARSYTGMGTALDDLLQAGKMGVLDGAEKFDTRKGCRFSTYVKYWIRKGMLALLAENSGVTLLPARMESIMRKVKEARRGIRYSQGRNPSDSEIAAAVGVSVANVRLARKCSRRPVSLYSEIGIGQHAKFAEVIPDEAAASAEAPDEAALFRGQLRERLLLVLGRLPAREGHVLRLRHGLEDGRCRSLEEIGGMYRVSKEWIRKIEKSAMARLRDDDDVRRDLHDFVCRF
ncbi:uncharacterized protein [Miscanthus floridulus]|uniref:uncharacterized protein isoform X2 n=1 Tax=Miscanthus floridulus TaxID=154761 RepID=UPI00345AF6E4